MKNVELKKESGIIKVRSPYEKAFISEVKMIGGKWDASEKTWDVPEENEEMLRALLLRCYGYAGEDSEMITVEYSPCDFPSMKQDPTTRIGGIKVLERRSRDGEVSFFNDTIVVSGGFYGSGGSVRYPAVNPKDGTICRSKITRAAYDGFGEITKARLTIVKEASKKERLEAEKAKLIARLAEIEKELEDVEG